MAETHEKKDGLVLCNFRDGTIDTFSNGEGPLVADISRYYIPKTYEAEALFGWFLAKGLLPIDALKAVLNDNTQEGAGA